METNINYAVVGAFVITLIAATILGIIWLSSGFSMERYTTYAIMMQESVSGLNQDSIVEYNGVNVGSVESVKLNEKNPRLVEVLVSLQSDTPITNGTVAMLSTRGITGVAYIGLKDNGYDLTPLVAQKGQKYPVIKTVPSIFVRLETALTQFTKNFQSMAKTFDALLDKQNLASFKATLLNLEKFSSTLAVNSHNFDEILTSTRKASFQLEMQTLPAAYRALSNIEDVSRTLNQVSLEVKQNPAILIRGVNRNAYGPGE